MNIEQSMRQNIFRHLYRKCEVMDKSQNSTTTNQCVNSGNESCTPVEYNNAFFPWIFGDFCSFRVSNACSISNAVFSLTNDKFHTFSLNVYCDGMGTTEIARSKELVWQETGAQKSCFWFLTWLDFKCWLKIMQKCLYFFEKIFYRCVNFEYTVILLICDM